MTEQRARAKTTFCLTRYPANAASRLISSSPLCCPWSKEGNPHVRGATLVPPAAASKWLKRQRRAQSIDRERDDSWMSAVEGPTFRVADRRVPVALRGGSALVLAGSLALEEEDGTRHPAHRHLDQDRPVHGYGLADEPAHVSGDLGPHAVEAEKTSASRSLSESPRSRSSWRVFGTLGSGVSWRASRGS